MKHTGLSGITYEIGETDLDVEALPGKREMLAANDMPDMKDVWGWDRCRKTERAWLAFGIDAARRTLADTDPEDIDAVIVCSGQRCNYFQQNQLIAQLAQTLRLGEFQSHWLGGAGCVTLFAAICLANTAIASETARRVLVLAVDRVEEDMHRFQRFGVLSDAACSFMVHDAAQADFTLIDAKTLSSAATLSRTEDFQPKCQLVQSVLERFGGPQGFDFARVEAFLGPNVFLPIQELELSLLPVDYALAYQENTARYGHCFCSDPIINLVDFHATSPGRSVSLMAATGHGHFGIVALERTARSSYLQRGGVV